MTTDDEPLARAIAEMEYVAQQRAEEEERDRNPAYAIEPDDVERALAFVDTFKGDARCGLNCLHSEALAGEVRRLRGLLVDWVDQIDDHTPIEMIDGVPHALYDAERNPMLVPLNQPTDRLWVAARMLRDGQEGATKVQPVPKNEETAPEGGSPNSNNGTDL